MSLAADIQEKVLLTYRINNGRETRLEFRNMLITILPQKDHIMLRMTLMTKLAFYCLGHCITETFVLFWLIM